MYLSIGQSKLISTKVRTAFLSMLTAFLNVCNTIICNCLIYGTNLKYFIIVSWPMQKTLLKVFI